MLTEEPVYSSFLNVVWYIILFFSNKSILIRDLDTLGTLLLRCWTRDQRGASPTTAIIVTSTTATTTTTAATKLSIYFSLEAKSRGFVLLLVVLLFLNVENNLDDFHSFQALNSI